MLSSTRYARRAFVAIAATVSATLVVAALMLLVCETPVQAQDEYQPLGVVAPLIVGTSLNPVGTNHDVFEIDVSGDMAQPLLPSFPVGGATFDAANGRVLFTSSSGSSNIDQLWEWPVGGTLNLLGTITDTVGGGAQRIDGLAMSGGVLYGSYAGGTAEDGIWIIDTGTLSATLVYPFSDSISGIDAHPYTGEIYGVNDTSAELVLINVSGNSMSPVTDYPLGALADMDGLAISHDGRAYLVTDEPGSIYVYNFDTASYESPLTAPWTSGDTFSGGAYVYPFAEPHIVIEKSPDVQFVASGADADFTIAVTNTGNVMLNNVMVIDPLVPACDNSLGDMAPGASTSYSCTDVGVTMSYVNMAEAAGIWLSVTLITDKDAAAVNLLQELWLPVIRKD